MPRDKRIVGVPFTLAKGVPLPLCLVLVTAFALRDKAIMKLHLLTSTCVSELFVSLLPSHGHTLTTNDGEVSQCEGKRIPGFDIICPRTARQGFCLVSIFRDSDYFSHVEVIAHRVAKGSERQGGWLADNCNSTHGLFLPVRLCVDDVDTLPNVHRS